ncbi:MAG TPA: AAA family ATPase [Gaiellaceae bacterium]|nr:AAA family ATPase [Gaiellaceae bacterium]
MELRLSFLGAPITLVDGAPLAVDTRKAVALVAYLAIEGGTHNRDSLAGLLWPNYNNERARAALRRTLSTLRAALGGRWLAVVRDSVSLDREGVLLDVDEFQRLSSETRLESLEQAAGLHRGLFLAGFGLRDSPAFDTWQSFRAGSYSRELSGLLDRVADERAAHGDWTGAIEHGRRRLALDPLHEPAHRRLIQLYSGNGERNAAVEQYRDCVRVLHRELGVTPIEATTALYRSVREGRAEAAAVAAPVPAEPALHEPAGHALVGRKQEWQALLDAYRSVEPDGQLVSIEGEAGIGKTRLGEELLSWTRAQGAVAVGVRCFEHEAGLAFGTAIGLVRATLHEGNADAVERAAAAEAARLVPELGTPPTPSLDDPGAQARFFDGIAQFVLSATAGGKPAVVLVDDVHWADPPSLDALAYLARRLRGNPVLLVLTWQPEETPPAHPARRMLADASRQGLGRRVAPSRLELDHVGELASMAGAPEELVARLYEETRGLPFFVVEYLDARADTREDWPVPPGVREVLEARIAASSELAAQVLAAAAVIARPFDLDTVRDVSGRGDDETVAALEELASRGILGELDGTYEFRHEQARKVAYERCSRGRRRRLHRRAAETLAARPDGSALPGAIAQHLLLAGREGEAAEWFRLAGERARDLYANVEALAHLRESLALGHPDAAALHQQIGDLRTLAGDYAGALSSYEAAAALGEEELLGAVEHRIGLVHHRRGEWALADSSFERALEASPDGGAERARILADRSLTAHRSGRDDEAQALAEQALALAGAAGDGRALAQAHNILGILASGRGERREARRQLEQSLALSAEQEDLAARAAALNNLALAYRADGELERALELTEEALALCAAVGDRHREAALTNNSADLLHAAGRREEALERLKTAVAIFAEVGEEGVMEPEIWKLVEW